MQGEETQYLPTAGRYDTMFMSSVYLDILFVAVAPAAIRG